MIKDLIKLANHLDSKGLVKEADYLDRIIKSAKNPLQEAGKATSTITREGYPVFLKFDLNGSRASDDEPTKYTGLWGINSSTESAYSDEYWSEFILEGKGITAEEIAEKVNDAIKSDLVMKQKMMKKPESWQVGNLNKNYDSVDKDGYKVYCKKGHSKCTDIINLLKF